MSRMTIGVLALRAGVGVETVRYYQRRGLFPEPTRAPGGVREYTPDCLELLRFIRRARAIGFNLREVERLIALRRAPTADGELGKLLADKAAELERQLDHLARAVAGLRELAAKCDAGTPIDDWSVLAASSLPDPPPSE